MNSYLYTGTESEKWKNRAKNQIKSIELTSNPDPHLAEEFGHSCDCIDGEVDCWITETTGFIGR